ncbi:hypothetical protein DFH27DRAFT_526522 [Peziza echinospora]|nr:hypothetical protein DFH27DRAFT_526522 [Peziza echinospora]
MAPPKGSTKSSSSSRTPANRKTNTTTQTPRRTYTHPSIDVSGFTRPQLILMARGLNLSHSGTTEEITARITAEIPHQKLDDLKALASFKPVFFPSKTPTSLQPNPTPHHQQTSASIDQNLELLPELLSQQSDLEQSEADLQQASQQFEQSQRQAEDSQMHFENSQSSQQLENPENFMMTHEELCINVSKLQQILLKQYDFIQKHTKMLNFHSTSLTRTINLSTATSLETINLRKAINEMEDSLSESINNIHNDIRQHNNSITALNAKIASIEHQQKSFNTQITSLNTDTDNISTQLQSIVNAQNFTSNRTEIQDRWMRGHNIMVFGWPVSTLPKSDAASFLDTIQYKSDFFSARRLPTTVAEGIERPGLLCITFPSHAECIEALKAYRIHQPDLRALSYYAKPDLTKSQRDSKNHADAGIRILREKDPSGNYCERSGRIALFKTNSEGRIYLHEWVANPLDSHTTTNSSTRPPSNPTPSANNTPNLPLPASQQLPHNANLPPNPYLAPTATTAHMPPPPPPLPQHSKPSSPTPSSSSFNQPNPPNPASPSNNSQDMDIDETRGRPNDNDNDLQSHNVKRARQQAYGDWFSLNPSAQ